MSLARAFKHLFAAPWALGSAFPKAALDAIEAAVKASEAQHRGEIRFAVEGALDFLPVLRGLTPRERALELFSLLRVWDTAENSGVLIYVQFVDRDIEIVADRGIAALIEQSEWDAICRRMEDAFRARQYAHGVAAGIRDVSALLATHFPAGAANADELPDRPVML
jgi:uncharacterized membrane protein YgcG